MCRRAWWGSCYTARGTGLTWWAGPHGIPEKGSSGVSRRDWTQHESGQSQKEICKDNASKLSHPHRNRNPSLLHNHRCFAVQRLLNNGTICLTRFWNANLLATNIQMACSSLESKNKNPHPTYFNKDGILTWKYITTANTKTVAMRFMRLGKFWR